MKLLLVSIRMAATGGQTADSLSVMQTDKQMCQFSDYEVRQAVRFLHYRRIGT